MKLRTLFFNIVIFGLLFIGCADKSAQVLDDTHSISERVEDLLSKLTLDEKISLLHANTKFNVGGIDRLGIPPLAMSDGPHGVREEVKPHSWDPAGWTTDSASYFPTGTALSATWNPQLVYEFGKALGQEARARQKDVILGPGINIMRTPLCGRNFEYMGEDPYLITRLVVPYINGVQEQDVAASLKHYVLNNQEYERSSINVEVDERALHEIYLPGYKAAVQEGRVMTVMAGYNKFREAWCAENKYIISDILKGDWGFKGLVMSDWDGTHSTVLAANAGLDVEMGTTVDDYDDYYFADPLLAAVKAGDVAETTIDDKARRVLSVMFELKMFDNDRLKGSFTTPEHFEIARKVAEEAVVLLKNKDQLLPLDRDKINSIAVIGDNAKRQHAAGGGSSGIKALYEVTPLMGLQNKLGDAVQINYSEGYKRSSEFSWSEGFIDSFDTDTARQWREDALAIAKESDIVIVFGGLNHDFDREGADRRDMKLPYAQDRLISEIVAVNPKTIVVLISGSPVEMPWIKNVPAVIQGWYAGMEGGNVFADVLCGDINPSGKLSFTFPKQLADSPAHKMNNYPGEDLTVNYQEGILVGYRWFDTKIIDPLFAFGHGLSYTQFDYSDLEITPDLKNTGEFIVSVNIKNSGSIAGKETVQLYIEDLESSLQKPKKELKEFAKVELQQGETKQLKFKLDHPAFSFYDIESGKWKMESGEFRIHVGSSSRDIRLTKNILIKG